MKTIKIILAALMLITFAATFSACEEDSPETIHSVSELSGSWSWETQVGDVGDCYVNISTMNNIIVIQNFQKQKGSITAEVKGDSFDFEGIIADGAYQITEGHGTILSNWTMIKISYTVSDGNRTDKISATLTKKSVTAKKK